MVKKLKLSKFKKLKKIKLTKHVLISVVMIVWGLGLGYWSIKQLIEINSGEKQRKATVASITQSLDEYNLVYHKPGEEFNLKTQKTSFKSAATYGSIENSQGIEFKPKEGKKFIIIEQRVINTTKQAGTYTPYIIFDDANRSYQAYTAKGMKGDNFLYGKVLKPGQPEEGILVFEIQENINNIRVGAYKIDTNELHLVKFKVK